MLAYKYADDYRTPAEQKMAAQLSQFTEQYIDNDGKVTENTVYDNRFLNTLWRLDMFLEIEQFKDTKITVKRDYKHFDFGYSKRTISLELKYIFYRNIFDRKWVIGSIFGNHSKYIKRVYQFLDQRYPQINSLMDIDLDEATAEWVDWLQEHGSPVTISFDHQKKNIIKYGKPYVTNNAFANYFPNLCKMLHAYLDDREEWEKDRWNVRNLEQYGVSYNKTSICYLVNFDSIKQPEFRGYTKWYLKHKLLNKTFAWNTARMYISYLPMFFNRITEMEPTWDTLQHLERKHIVAYIGWLDQYIADRPPQKKSNPAQYKNRALTIAHKFLSDMQLYENEIAPIRDIRTLIFPEDKPQKLPRAYDQAAYIPDFVLDQLFQHINELHSDAIPVVWIMYKTGLRVSDALLLRQDCLVKLNGKYWIETDIEKTYTKGHRIPIDHELASVIAGLIDRTKQNSNQYNNPERFIFARLSGSRRGHPMGQYLIRDHLNSLAYYKNIVDESGKWYHFTNHAFRHIYAVKLLNGGADIITIQELLAHASPEMTMRYARLMDDTKRKSFDRLVKQGIFHFDDHSNLKEMDCTRISKETIDMLWTNHKLEALDTPYGTCLQRSKGNCNFAKQPPCLTCNSSHPCKDLCIGAFDGDIQKYEILISSVTALIEQANQHGRTLMAAENMELLKIYQGIYDAIQNGNLIYGRAERLAI